jgi:hypothetical protein
MPIVWDDELKTSNIVWDDENKNKKKETLTDKISNRTDIYGEAVKGLENFKPSLNPLNMLGQTADIGLKSVGGIAQRTESAIANPFILKEGRPQNPIQAIREGLTGKQLGELGDVARQAGLPEFAAAGLGLLGTGILGGALSKTKDATKIAESLAKVETNYGKDIGKNVIRWSTGMPDIAVEHGMKRGWKNVLTKSNLDATLPTKLAKTTLDDLTEISAKEYDDYGKAIDSVNKGFVKGVDLLDTVQQQFVKSQYINPDGTKAIRMRPKFVNDIQTMYDKWIQTIKPDDNIPIPMLQNIRTMAKKVIPKTNLTGKTRTLTEEQRFAKDLYAKMNDMIGFNAYGVENKTITNAKRSYRTFKNNEKLILDTFSETVGQETVPTADKVVGLFKLQRTKAAEELSKLNQVNDYLVGKGYEPIKDKLMDWLTTQSAIVEPQAGGASLYPFRLLAESTKYGARQTLKSGITSKVGKGIQKTGKGISKIKDYSKEHKLGIASIIRANRELED